MWVCLEKVGYQADERWCGAEVELDQVKGYAARPMGEKLPTFRPLYYLNSQSFIFNCIFYAFIPGSQEIITPPT